MRPPKERLKTLDRGPARDGRAPTAADMARVAAHIHDCSKVPEMREEPHAQAAELAAYSAAGLIFALDRAAERLEKAIGANTYAIRALVAMLEDRLPEQPE